jgi:hypothetical protein
LNYPEMVLIFCRATCRGAIERSICSKAIPLIPNDVNCGEDLIASASSPGAVRLAVLVNPAEATYTETTLRDVQPAAHAVQNF